MRFSYSKCRCISTIYFLFMLMPKPCVKAVIFSSFIFSKKYFVGPIFFSWMSKKKPWKFDKSVDLCKHCHGTRREQKLNEAQRHIYPTPVSNVTHTMFRVASAKLLLLLFSNLAHHSVPSGFLVRPLGHGNLIKKCFM